MIRRAFGLTATILLTAWALTDSRYFTAWFAIYWGIITAIGMATLSGTFWDAHLSLALPVQFMLLVFLLVGACLATDWTHLTARDSIQWVWTATTGSVFWDGFKWGINRIVHT